MIENYVWLNTIDNDILKFEYNMLTSPNKGD